MCFCKQKTAYEMRISDWSSDVCSSDLDQVSGAIAELVHRRAVRQFGVAQYLDAIGVDHDVLRRRQKGDDDRPERKGRQMVVGRIARTQLPDREDQQRLDHEPPASIGRSSCRESGCK